MHIHRLMLFITGMLATAILANADPPPVPPVESLTDLGVVHQNPVVQGRDGTYSALIAGRSVWNFGDTPLTKANAEGNNWVDNSLSWTENLDASAGITLEHDYLDSAGAPAEIIPYTPQEKFYNYLHDPDNCRADPCGAEFAFWPAQMVPDPARKRVLLFYTEIWRVPGAEGWKTVGGGIAIADTKVGMSRPIVSPGTAFPTLMWTGDNEVQFNSEGLVIGDMLYAYGQKREFLTQHAQLARVPLEDALDKSRWSYYAGTNTWSSNAADAVTVFDGGAAGNSVFFNPYLGAYMAIYSGVFSDNLYYRVSDTPWGPWSAETLLLTAKTGWNNTTSYAGRAHPEFAQENGRIQYITYARTTGFLRQELPLVKVVFGKP